MPPPHIRIDLENQHLRLLEGARLIKEYAISTGIKGAGEQSGSGCTPRGLHRIRIRIGNGQPFNSVFVGRRPTGEVWTPELGARHPQRDWILTRILWLTGLEFGRNRGGERDTLRRFIYIHGTPESEPLGEPRSHGCIRMHSRDVLDLFDRVRAGTLVDIREWCDD